MTHEGLSLYVRSAEEIFDEFKIRDYDFVPCTNDKVFHFGSAIYLSRRSS